MYAGNHQDTKGRNHDILEKPADTIKYQIEVFNIELLVSTNETEDILSFMAEKTC